MDMSRLSHAPSHFTPEETAVGTHCICGWVGPGAGPVVVEAIDLVPLPEIELRLPAVQPVV
jgi:hypothetical protein